MGIATLILLNGPPGVGKSALARRYADDHPLTLLLEIDAIRVSLGAWDEHDESKLLARMLATAMAEAHLRAGHDVIVPQYLGRTEFIESLARLARRLDAAFVEVLLLDAHAALVERFRARRADLAVTGRPHPQDEVTESAVPALVADALSRLAEVEAARAHTRVVVATGGTEATYRALCDALDLALGTPPP